MELQETLVKIRKEGPPEGGKPLYPIRIVEQDDSDRDFVTGIEGREKVGIKILERNPKYQLLDNANLGKGGGGTVNLAYEAGYEGEQTETPRLFALKKVDMHKDSPTTVEEARELARLNNPYISRIFEIVADDDQNVYMVMEYIEGPKLSDIQSDLAPFVVQKIAHQICSSVSYLHKNNRLHNDIKPNSFIFTRALTRNMEDVDLKLIDMGGVTEADAAVGERMPKVYTPGWVAPDREKGVWDQRSEVYMTAQVIGHLIFDRFLDFTNSEEAVKKSGFRSTFKSGNAEGQKMLKDVIMKACRKDINKRYGSIKEFYSDLNKAFIKLGCKDRYPYLID